MRHGHNMCCMSAIIFYQYISPTINHTEKKRKEDKKAVKYTLTVITVKNKIVVVAEIN